MIDWFLSDRRRLVKLAGLGLIYLALVVYYHQGPSGTSEWERLAAWAKTPEAFRGRRVELYVSRVLRLLPEGKGLVVGIGPAQRFEVTLLGSIAAGPGDYVDVIGLYQGGRTISLLDYHRHRPGRRVKVAASAAAALLVVGLFFWTFRLRLSRSGLIVARE